jgi:hypothetical protein
MLYHNPCPGCITYAACNSQIHQADQDKDYELMITIACNIYQKCKPVRLFLDAAVFDTPISGAVIDLRPVIEHFLGRKWKTE